nr:MAG TPA: hypothetical protein [Caudoviricetes sp.]
MYENFGVPMYNPSVQFPYQSPYRPQQSNDIQGVRFVDGLEGAKACMVPMGNKALLMDQNTQRFFIKDVDYNGIATLKAYEFHEISSSPSNNQYVTRQEFEELKSMLMNGGKNESTVQSEEANGWAAE